MGAFDDLVKRISSDTVEDRSLKRQKVEEEEEEEESVLELTKEQMEEYKAQLGDDFELVAVGEEGFEEEEEEEEIEEEEELEEEGEFELEDDEKIDEHDESEEIDEISSQQKPFTFWENLENLEMSRTRQKFIYSVDDLPESLLKSIKATNVRFQSDSDDLDRTIESISSSDDPFLSLLQTNKDLWVSHCGTSHLRQFRASIAEHVVHHSMSTRKAVVKNNAKLKKLDGKNVDDDSAEEFKDQGFTRPRILVICPFRNSAYRMVNLILDACPEKVKKEVVNRSRFEEEYGPPKLSESEYEKVKLKPKDYQKTFEGNIDDCFRFGMSFYDRSIRLFTDFYGSDIIFASPLGLRMTIGAPGEAKRDFDFLSSIEMLVITEAHVFSMQNYDHMTQLMNCINLIPVSARETDFSRIRDVYLNEQAPFCRQTILLSEYMNRDLNILFNKYCKNFRGRIKTRKKLNDCLRKVALPIRQLFRRFPVDSLKDEDEKRFEFFRDNVFNHHHRNHDRQTLIFISSYFDFVRVRNYLRSKKIIFASCDEYSDKKMIDRGKSYFATGRIRYMLVTERFLYFRRHKLKGFTDLIMYSLPENPQFYPDLMNMLKSTAEQSAVIMFDKYDSFALERIVGTQRCVRLLSSPEETFLFC